MYRTRPAPAVLAGTLSALLGTAAIAQTDTTQSPASAAPGREQAAGAELERLIVLNKAGGTASLFDPRTRKEVAVVEVGTGPHEVAVSPDGRTAVVCNYGDQQPGSTLTVIDVARAEARTTFVLDGEEQVDGETKKRTYLRPHGIRYLPDGRHVVVTSEQVRRLLLVDIDARKVVRALPTPQSTLHMVALGGDGRSAFGTSIRDGSLAFFDLAPPAAATGGGDAPAAATTVRTGDGAEGLAVCPATGEVWVGNRAEDTLSVVDPATREVKARLDTASFPIRVECTPDGRWMLVSCAEAGQVQVFDARERKLAHTVDLLGEQTELSPLPIGICIEPDGRAAWVACARGEFLAVIDLQEFALVDRVPAGPGPDGMAFARIAAAADDAGR